MTDEPRAAPTDVHEQTNIGISNEFNPPKLYHVRVVRLGFLHLVLGIFTLCVGVFDVAFSAVAFDVFTQAKIAAGIWVGTVIVVTGCIGLVTSRSELRRRTTILAFGVFSAASLLCSMFLIGITISEMVTSSVTKGELLVEGANCTSSASLNATSPVVRCVAKTTFDQKLATASMLIIFGFLESLTAVISIITTRDIFVNKYTNTDPQNGNELNMSVSQYFDRRLNEEPNTINNGTFDRRDGRSTDYTNPMSSELPDSDQFRSHLEGVGWERNYGSAYQ